MFSVSHPTWVRGLKQTKIADIQRQQEVAPYVGAWIETKSEGNSYETRGSHPTWVRGLKLQTIMNYRNALRRTLRGCVD